MDNGKEAMRQSLSPSCNLVCDTITTHMFWVPFYQRWAGSCCKVPDWHNDSQVSAVLMIFIAKDSLPAPVTEPLHPRPDQQNLVGDLQLVT